MVIYQIVLIPVNLGFQRLQPAHIDRVNVDGHKSFNSR